MSFFAILSESAKLLLKNGKLLSILALCYVVFTSSVFWLFHYTLTSLSDDLTNHIFVASQQSFMPDPTIPGFSPAQATGPFRQLQKDFAIILAVVFAFFLAYFIISFFSTISTILITATSDKSKNLSLKELLSIICTQWLGPLITTFYVTALLMGYFYVVSILATPLLMYRSKATLSVAILIGIVALVFYICLSVTWGLAIVVSVLEESCFGLKALGRAASLVEGKMLQGFLINFCFELLGSIFFGGYKFVLGYKRLLKYPVMFGLVAVIFFGVVKIFVAVTYTVMYFKCKKDHGEEIELYGGNIKYSKVQNMELGNGIMA